MIFGFDIVNIFVLYFNSLLITLSFGGGAVGYYGVIFFGIVYYDRVFVQLGLKRILVDRQYLLLTLT